VVAPIPDNLPFSHQDGSGFENRIAELVAQGHPRALVYRWMPLRRGVVRKTLDARLCDVLMECRPIRRVSRRPSRTTDRAMRSSRARSGGAPVRHSTT
jgi:hypothetical protein